MRLRRLRRLHGFDRRRGALLVHDSVGKMSAQADCNDRGTGGRRQAGSPAGKFCPLRCGTVRLLHLGNDLDGQSPAAQESAPERERRPMVPGRKSVPLHRLSKNRPGRRGDWQKFRVMSGGGIVMGGNMTLKTAVLV